MREHDRVWCERRGSGCKFTSALLLHMMLICVKAVIQELRRESASLNARTPSNPNGR
jgi:hypothetical protein